MSRQANILFSSRDPGGVGHIVSLLDAFRQDPRFEVSLVASDPALSLLRQAGEFPRMFVFANCSDHIEVGEDPTRLLEAAGRLLAEVRPDAVFVSLSSFGVGIDEALLAATHVPRFAMQDFWGDVNLGLGVPADIYFVIDDFAACITRERWGVTALPVGSPKHDRYRSLDIDRLRNETRSSLGVGANRAVIGFFGQSSDIPGHEAAFEDLAQAASVMVDRPLFLLRDHAKFPADRIDKLIQLGLAAVDVTSKSTVETWLAACDVAVTCFSSAALDHAFLSAYSRNPIGTALYLLSNPEIQAFVAEVCGFPAFPTVEQGLGKVAKDPGSVAPLLESALWETERRAYHAASKRLSKALSLNRILDEVAREVGASAKGVVSSSRRSSA